jgi:hypothetical protein
MGASLSQGVAGGKAQAPELSCTSWVAASRSSDVSKDDDEVVARNTLERGLNWAHRAFDELILPATSVSFLVRRPCHQFFGLSRSLSLIFTLMVEDPQVIGSKTCPRGARAPRGKDSARDATRRGRGHSGCCDGERGVRADVP